MATNFVRWFQPPVFQEDEDKTRSALLLNVILITFLLAIPVLILGAILGGNVPRLEKIIPVMIGAWLTIFGTRLTMMRGRVALAGKVTVMIIYIAATLVIYNVGTIRAPVTAFYLLIIVVSGLVISRRAIVWVAALSTLTILLFIVAERNSLLPPPTLTVSLSQGVTFTVVFTIISVLLYLAVKSIDEALGSARQELKIRKQVEEALQRTNSRLAILHEIDRALLASSDVHLIAQNALAGIRQLIPCPRASITLFDHEKREARFLAADYDEKVEIPATPISFEEFGQRIIDELLKNNRWFSDDVLLDPQVTELDKRLVDEMGIRVWLSLPLMIQESLIGALNLGRHGGHPFIEEEAAIVHDIANQLAIALQQIHLDGALHNELAERKKLIVELEQRNDELTRFTYTVSHDLRSPLVTIKGFIGMLNKDLQEHRPEKVQNDLQRIAGATDKMSELLSDLLELSRIGRTVNPPVEVDTARLIQDALDSVEARLRSKNVTVNVLPDLPTLHGDRLRLREVFENLIDNAAKYMGDQTEPLIEIGAKGLDGECVYYVKDNGMGIAPLYHTRIFSLFEKLNPASEGTGIGLTLVKRIIETHGGSIWVESEGDGQGTAFYFTVPMKTSN